MQQKIQQEMVWVLLMAVRWCICVLNCLTVYDIGLLPCVELCSLRQNGLRDVFTVRDDGEQILERVKLEC